MWNDLTLSGVLLAQEPSAVPEQWRAPPAAPAATVRRSATARWQGDLRAGGGELDLDSGAAPTMPFSLRARRDGSSAATSAEELLAAAHASCFAMALRGALDRAHDHGEDSADDGTVEVRATCTLRIDASGWTIDAVALEVSAPGVRSARLAAAVASAERTCAVSQLVQDRALVTVTVAAARVLTPPALPPHLQPRADRRRRAEEPGLRLRAHHQLRRRLPPHGAPRRLPPRACPGRGRARRHRAAPRARDEPRPGRRAVRRPGRPPRPDPAGRGRARRGSGGLHADHARGRHSDNVFRRSAAWGPSPQPWHVTGAVRTP